MQERAGLDPIPALCRALVELCTYAARIERLTADAAARRVDPIPVVSKEAL